MSNLMITVLEGWAYSVHNGGETALPFRERQPDQIIAIEKEQVEYEKNQGISVPGIRCCLNDAERGRSIRTHATELAIEVHRSYREPF